MPLPPIQDVAYALTTSLEAALLPRMDELVDLYVSRLAGELRGEGLPEGFRSHFDLVWLDYIRVVVTGLWKRLSHEQIQKYQKKI